MSGFCLAAGSLTLFMSLLAIVAGCAVKEAVADGRSVAREFCDQEVRFSDQGQRGGEAGDMVCGQPEQLPRHRPDPGLHGALFIRHLLL